MKIRYAIICLTVVLSQAANALTLSQAKKLYSEGQFDKALSTFVELVKKNPKNASYNQWAGACLYETGRTQESEKYFQFALSKNIPDAARYLAQIALDDMDYEKAAELTRRFEELAEDTSGLSETAQEGYRRLKRLSDMLNNVEKIQIFDSLVVDKNDFFRHYRLTHEAGTLNGPDILPSTSVDNVPSVVFMPQSGNRMVWTMPDSTGRKHLTETYRLADGKWDRYTRLSDKLSDNGDSDYPFVMADGTTIYYANNGDNGMGGYDIYMSRKDFTSGDYLQPQNIGMPYNSPFDDYMLVIDEMTGIGWWASDRNRIPGKLTIYMFKRNDIRENYDRNSPDIFTLAAVHAIKDSWTDGNYDDLKNLIRNISDETEKPKEDFSFFIKNDVEYTRYDQFRSEEAENLMHKRTTLVQRFDTHIRQLDGLRKKYAKSTASVKERLASEILGLENALLKDYEDIKQMENEIRSIELPLL